MGQRLVVNIRKGKDKTIASCYFHWSGYTRTALDITASIVSNLIGVNTTSASDYDIAVDAFNIENYSVGFEHEEVEYITENLPHIPLNDIPKNNDRNEGLLVISPKGISETEGAGEMTVDIDIVNHTVFGDFLYPDEYIDEMPDVSECEQSPVPLDKELSYDELFVLADDYEDGKSYFSDDDDNVYKGIY